MTGRLVVENLKHRPMRTMLSVLLIGVPVTLILSLVGVSEGMSQDAQNRARATGADIVIRPGAASAIASFSSSSITEKYVGLIGKKPHIKAVSGVNVHSIDFPLSVMGVDLRSFDAISGGFHFLEGGPFQGPYDAMIDDYYSRQNKLGVGSTLKLLNHQWRVTGVFESGMLARVVVPRPTLQELISATGKVNQILVKIDNPANTDAVVEQLRSDPDLATLEIKSMEEYTSLFLVTNYKTVKVFTYVVIGIGVVIGFAVVCLSMYMAVLQRTREIGILKSIGASKEFILRIILVEAALLGVGGTSLGVLMSYGACWAIRTFIPASFPMIIVYAWWPRALFITLAGALAGALYPGLGAASHDPIEALAYE